MANNQNLSRAGRPKNAKNIIPAIDELREACYKAGYDWYQAVVEMAQGQMPCTVCFGRGQTYYATTDSDGNTIMHGDGEVDENGYDVSGQPVMALRRCASCMGTLREKIKPETIGEMRKKILDKFVPNLNNVDHQVDGPGVGGGITVIMQPVQALAPGGSGAPMLMDRKE